MAPQTCDNIARLEWHSGGVRALSFVYDYPVLVSADSDGSLCVWGVRGGSVMLRNVVVTEWLNVAKPKTDGLLAKPLDPSKDKCVVLAACEFDVDWSIRLCFVFCFAAQ